jgi:preprotein translocase subunit SecE
MASTEVETVNTTLDKSKLAGSAALVIAGLVAFYMLSKQGSLAQWGALLVGLVAAVVVFLTSEYGRQFVALTKDSVKEAQKVVWPTRKEAIQLTAYVFVFVVVMALFLFGVDKLVEWIIYSLLLQWK